MKQSLLSILFLCISIAVSAHDFVVDGIYYNIDDTNKTATVTYKGDTYNEYSNEYAGIIVIPSSITYGNTTYNVTSIEEYAFYDCNGIESVTIPSCITDVGNFAFNGCTGLKELRIEDSESTLSLGYNLYDNSTKEDTVIIGSGNSYVNSLPNFGSITAGKGLFYDCPLEILYLGRNISYRASNNYGYSPFYNKSGMTRLTIGKQVDTLENYAFLKCFDIKELHINDLVSWLNIDFGNQEANPLAYAKHVYLDGKQVTEIVVPDCITKIKKYTFGYFVGLKSITFHNGISEIGIYAFQHCTGLERIELPNGITSIEKAVFYSCTGLVDIVIPESVKSIGPWAFGYCSNLKSIDIPSRVTEIGYFAFYNCRSLEKIEIPERVESLGMDAFSNCEVLTEITLPNSIRKIGDGVFSYCNSLTSIDMPDSITRIENSTFLACSSLENITFGNCIESIGENAFRECTSLESIYIPGCVDSIEKEAFSECTGLKSITIGDGVKSVGDKAFRGCYNVEKIYIGNAVERIGYGAFNWTDFNTYEIKVASEKPITADYDIFSEYLYYITTLYVPSGCKAEYENIEPWSLFDNITETDFTGIDEVKDMRTDDKAGNKSVYDLNGRKVNQITAPGIYIINNKKVLVK